MKKLLLSIPILAALCAAQSYDYVPPTTVNGLHVLGGASGTGLVLSSGTPNADPNAAITIQSNGTGAVTIQPGANGGTIVIGGTAQTGAITVGSSSGAETLNLGTGAGNSTVNIATGAGTNALTIGVAGTTVTTTILGKVKGDCSTGTAVANAVTIQSQCGVITSSTANLGATTSESITLTDARIAATNVMLATISSPCTTGEMMVESATPGAGSATIRTRNLAAAACTTTYQVSYWILSQ